MNKTKEAMISIFVCEKTNCKNLDSGSFCKLLDCFNALTNNNCPIPEKCKYKTLHIIGRVSDDVPRYECKEVCCEKCGGCTKRNKIKKWIKL